MQIPSVGSILLHFLTGELAGALAKSLVGQDKAVCWGAHHTMCSFSADIHVLALLMLSRCVLLDTVAGQGFACNDHGFRLLCCGQLNQLCSPVPKDKGISSFVSSFSPFRLTEAGPSSWHLLDPFMRCFSARLGP